RYTKRIVAPLRRGVIGVVHHVIPVAILDDPRPLGHAIIVRFPGAWQGGKQCDRFTGERPGVLHLPCPYGVAICKLYHVEVRRTVVVDEEFRIDAVVQPGGFHRLLIGTEDIRSGCMTDMYDVAIATPIVHGPVLMKYAVDIDNVVRMNLAITCRPAFGPLVVHGKDVDRSYPIAEVIRLVETSLRKAAANVILAAVADDARIGGTGKHGIIDVRRYL